MPFVLILAGVVLIISAVRNTQQSLFYLLALDFTGPNNFIFWFLSILVIGALGYIPKAKPLSDGFLILVILVLFLKKGKSGVGGGFFEQFQRQISLTTSARPQVSATGTSGGSTSISTVGGPIFSGGGITINPTGFGGAGVPGSIRAGNSIFDPNSHQGCDPFFDPLCVLATPGAGYGG
jgi:hypothetical protein